MMLCSRYKPNLVVCQGVKFVRRFTKFGGRLKALRQERKQTQKAMGELLGCTASNYQKIEYGEVNLPISSLMTLADYFEVTTDYLLGRSDQRQEK